MSMANFFPFISAYMTYMTSSVKDFQNDPKGKLGQQQICEEKKTFSVKPDLLEHQYFIVVLQSVLIAYLWTNDPITEKKFLSAHHFFEIAKTNDVTRREIVLTTGDHLILSVFWMQFVCNSSNSLEKYL